MSTHHTRSTSMSAPKTLSDRPPGYGPRATIPDHGFVPNPDSILYRPGPQRRRPTTVDDNRSSNMEPNFMDSSGDPNMDHDNHAIRLSVSFHEITEITVQLPLDSMVSQGHLGHGYSFLTITCTPEQTSNRQTRCYSTDAQVLSPSIVWLQSLLDENDSEGLRRQTASCSSNAESVSAPLSAASAATSTAPSSIPAVSEPEDREHEPDTPLHSADDVRVRMPNSNEDSDSDSDDSYYKPSRKDSFGGEPDVVIDIRAPKSTELFSTTYVESIRDVLLEYMSHFQIPYFMGLVIFTAELSTDPDIPAVVIVFEKESIDDDHFPSVDDLPAAIKNSGYTVLFCEGTFDELADSMSNRYRHLHESLMSGISIEASEIGTVGLFLEAEEDKFYGFSCGHVLGRVGNSVGQPSLLDFNNHKRALGRAVRNLEREIQKTKNIITKHIYQDELDKISQQIDTYKKYQGENDDATKKLLRVGKTVKSEDAIVEYQGRMRYADWAVFLCDRQRLPGNEIILDLNTPDEGVLSTVEWHRMNDFAPIQLDMYVRKAGRTTGMTFGFIAGVYSSRVLDASVNKSCEEWYVLEEKPGPQNQFAAPGDSGAAVINDEGKVVGFVYAGIKITNVKIVFDRSSRTPDILKIKERRQVDGSVNLENVYSEYILGQKFILVESAEMVLERANIKGEIVCDC